MRTVPCSTVTNLLLEQVGPIQVKWNPGPQLDRTLSMVHIT